MDEVPASVCMQRYHELTRMSQEQIHERFGENEKLRELVGAAQTEPPVGSSAEQATVLQTPLRDTAAPTEDPSLCVTKSVIGSTRNPLERHEDILPEADEKERLSRPTNPEAIAELKKMVEALRVELVQVKDDYNQLKRTERTSRTQHEREYADLLQCQRESGSLRTASKETKRELAVVKASTDALSLLCSSQSVELDRMREVVAAHVLSIATVSEKDEENVDSKSDLPIAALNERGKHKQEQAIAATRKEGLEKQRGERENRVANREKTATLAGKNQVEITEAVPNFNQHFLHFTAEKTRRRDEAIAMIQNSNIQLEKSLRAELAALRSPLMQKIAQIEAMQEEDRVVIEQLNADRQRYDIGLEKVEVEAVKREELSVRIEKRWAKHERDQNAREESLLWFQEQLQQELHTVREQVSQNIGTALVLEELKASVQAVNDKLTTLGTKQDETKRYSIDQYLQTTLQLHELRSAVDKERQERSQEFTALLQNLQRLVNSERG